MSKESRTPLVLIPGLMDDAELWSHQQKNLSSVAASHVANISEHDTVAGMAKAVLEAAPPQFALAGFSLGGYVALEIMRQAPTRVLKLALLCTSAREDTSDRRTERQAQVAATRDRKALESFIRKDIRTTIRLERLTDEPLVSAIVGMAMRQGPDVFARQQVACMRRPDSRSYLSRILCPTLVLCGREDRVLPIELSQEIAAAVRISRYMPIEESGHYISLEQPQAVTALMYEWLVYA